MSSGWLGSLVAVPGTNEAVRRAGGASSRAWSSREIGVVTSSSSVLAWSVELPDLEPCRSVDGCFLGTGFRASLATFDDESESCEVDDAAVFSNLAANKATCDALDPGLTLFESDVEENKCDLSTSRESPSDEPTNAFSKEGLPILFLRELCCTHFAWRLDADREKGLESRRRR